MSSRRHRAVLLLHGLCSTPLELRQFAAALRDAGFHVHTPTLAGYSATASNRESDSDPASYRRWIADCAREVEACAATCDELLVCGVSLGATLALAVAAERPALVSGLSLISTTLFFDGWNISRWRFLLPLACYTPLGRFYRYRETPPYGVKNPRVRAWIAREFERGRLSSAGAATIPTSSLREADRLIRHVKRTLNRVRAPLLMIHAREDDVASLANVDYVRERVATTTFREIIVTNSYHMITLDNDRDHAALKTVQFFNTRGDNAAARRLHAGP
ncbi:MAG TPA: alpha/beta fold hydrolase [Casimicrobiaceae bacterium]|nr:alpha/beta fold hydrolase [Casimicrobiaceae bacterium]